MTSKRKLRAEIERLQDDYSYAFLSGWTAREPGNHRLWQTHLSRVTDAAREQGRREGWSAAWAAGARADEDAYRRGWEDAVADATLAAGDDATPEDAEPPADEVNRFSGGYRNSQGEWIECGCRACQPDAWWMVVCGVCGDKRCPHALDHANLCTGPEPHGETGGPCCGFACCCQHPPVAGWTPGSVTR